MSEGTGGFLLRQKIFQISILSRKFEFPTHKMVNNLFKLSAQDTDLEYFPVSSDLKPTLRG